MFINVVNALTGVSIFAMPWGYSRAGLVGGTFVLMLVSYLSLDTSILMLQAQRRLFVTTGKVYGFPEVCGSILGEVYDPIVKLATCISCLGGCAGYLIFLGELCSQLFSISYPLGVGVSAVPLVLISWIRTFKELMSITMMGVTSIILAVGIILFKGADNYPNFTHGLQREDFIKTTSILDFVGPSTFLFTIHYCVLSMGSEVLVTASKTSDDSLDVSSDALRAGNLKGAFMTLLSVLISFSSIHTLYYGSYSRWIRLVWTTAARRIQQE